MPKPSRSRSENAVLNGVGDLCRFVHAIGLRNDELQARLPYDLVVANILAGPLMELSDSFSAAVRPGGRALLSGLLLEQADDILAVYRRWGFALERHIDLETGGAMWRTLLLRRAEALNSAGLRCGPAGERIGRMGQAHVVAQGRAAIPGRPQAAALQLGHDQLDEVAQAARLDRHGQHEAVAGLAAVPVLHHVGDLDRIALHHVAAIVGSTRS